MSLALLLALSGSAQAESEILFRTTRPVMIFVDGRQAPLTGNLKMRAAELEPGLHDVEVRGVFGKTLYATEMELPDWTVAHAEWTGRDLELVRTEALARRGRTERPSPWADEEAPAEAPVKEEAPRQAGPIVVPEPVPEELPVPEATEPAAEPAPEAVAPEGTEGELLALPADPEPLVAAQAEVPAAVPPVGVGEVAWIEGEEVVAVEPVEPSPADGEADPVPAPTMTVQAREGVRVQLVSEEGTLWVTVKDGAFLVDFGADQAEE